MSQIQFLLNGTRQVLDDPDPRTTLLDWLREERHLTGTKEGCNEGDCGACTVTVSQSEDGEVTHHALNACILFLPQLHGKAVRTVEGIAPQGELHPVQRAMVEAHGSQCGFCTPGIVMSLYTAHLNGRTDYDDVLAGNLCRCTGYAPIIRAAKVAGLEAGPSDDQADALEALTPAGDVHIPTDLDQFAHWYVEHPDATIVAGATDVGLWVTKQMRDIRPAVFLHRLKDLQTLIADETGITIGAGVSLARLRGAMIGRHSDFAELIRRYGSVQVRNAATIGGNIANGSPIGDGPPALIALGAELTLRRGDERRTMPLEDFFLDYGKQHRQPGEFVESIFVPAQPDTLKCYKISKRFDQDISAVCGCFNITVEGEYVTSARVAFGGMAAIPKRALAVEAAMIGQHMQGTLVEPVQSALEQDFRPISDMRASAEYRMRVAKNLPARAIMETCGAPLAQTRIAGRGAI